MRGIGRAIGEIAIESLLRSLRAGGIDFTRIKPPALFLILEQVVSSRYVLKLRLRLLVARTQIGMEFACPFLECVLDFSISRGSIYAEGLVRVLHAHDPIQATSCVPSFAANTSLRRRTAAPSLDYQRRIGMMARPMALTPELVARVQRLVEDAGPAPGLVYYAEEDYDDAVRDIIVSHPRGQDLWVFAYGSLIWKPEMEHVEERIGTAHGWHRSCQPLLHRRNPSRKKDVSQVRTYLQPRRSHG
jgi:hypothetical protein